MTVGKRAEQTMGLKLRSELIDAGPVPHQGIAYDNQEGMVAAKG